MAYITQADLEARFGADEIMKLADRDGDSVADAEVVAAAIADAQAVIDTHLTGRYELPMNPPPTVITRLACAIARYHLYDDRPTARVVDEYHGALATLEKIGAGELMLVRQGAQGSAPDFSEGDPLFDDMEDY